MKTIKQTILGIALFVLSLAVNAQCVTITNLNVSLGANGTASITPVTTGTTSPMFTTYYWQMYPNTGQNNAPGQSMAEFQFPANGTYSICLNISDSLNNGCWSNQYCTTLTINNMAPSSCNASFTAYSDSNCVTYFTNTSTGGTAYEWNINGVTYNSTNPSVSLPNGSYPVLLQTYYAGQPCDSVYQTINVGCSGNNTVSCVANFTSFTDTSCVTHLTNTSTGTNLTYEWYEITNTGSTLISTATNPVLNLPQGYYHIQMATFSNGTFCDSAVEIINVNCSNPSGGCQAVSQFIVFPDSTNPASGNYYAYNTSYGSGLTSYLWSFGDGTSSTQQYPFHQYAVPGQYIICLTVNVTYTTSLGSSTCTATYCDSSSVQKTASFLMSQMNVIPQTVTGIKQLEHSTSINAFPNPMYDQLMIEAISGDSKLTYVLMDAIGRTVLTGNIDNSKAILNTGSLAKGFYNLSITNEDGYSLKTIKLVK